jgi:tetratricopeptide (TPR) repeat protein/DNA-binding CsgD family transcriptional regulator
MLRTSDKSADNLILRYAQMTLCLIIFIGSATSLKAYNIDNKSDNATIIVTKSGDTTDIGILTGIAGKFDINDPKGLDSSLLYLNAALQMAIDMGVDRYYYSIYGQYTGIFMKSGNYSLALDYYFKMLKLLDEEASGEHDTVVLYRRYASLYTSIGVCYFNMDNFKSLDYYRKSLDAVKKLAEIDPTYPALERQMMLHINIGSAYLNNYDFTEAERNFQKALEVNESLNNPVNEASLYNNLGIVFKEKKDFDKAFSYYEKALSIRLSLNDSFGLAQTYNNLGDAYCLTGRYNTAIEMLNKAFLLSSQTGNLRSQMKAANFLSIAWEKKGDYPRSLEMYKVYSALHDSIISNERVQNAIRLELQYQFEKQLKENELQQQIVLAKKERTTLIYMVISGMLLFSITILILLYRNQRMSMKHADLLQKRLELEGKNLTLEKQNLLIEKQKLEMDLDFKNKELSTHVIYLLKKNEFISSIIQKLITYSKSSTHDAVNESWVKDIMREMQSNIDNTVWNEFEIRFQQVHHEFYQKLTEKYPDLTPNEIKICAFLKLNMTTKDISAITFQSVKSIQVARNRLRRKMGIERDENLVSLLQQL